MHAILLIALGSHGDVHPFVGLGQALRGRGHRVDVVANAYFEPLVRRAGLGFLALGSADEYRALVGEVDLWHPTRSFKIVFEKGVLEFVRPLYALIADYAASHGTAQTVVVASSLGLGARVAQEKLGLATATVHLAPVVFRSEHDTPRLPGAPLRPWMPAWIKRLVFAAADKLVIDPLLAPPLNAFRAELGLPPVKGILKDWLNSPQLVIGLFPPWFASPQPDWPPQTRLTGFPLYDEHGLEPSPPELLQFLDEAPPGDEPIAFTPGSAMWQGRPFFEASADACRRMGRRGLLLTRHREHVPPHLPPGVLHVDYAPFSRLLPRCAALVHHGGIGTSAQALASGVRQLIMPMAFDQPDNALRLQRLGVARVVPPKRYRGPRVAGELQALLDSPEVEGRCRAVAEKLRGTDPIGQTCDLIEQLADARRP